MNKPNILLIMTDQLRGDCLGFAGHPDVKLLILIPLPAEAFLLTMLTAPVQAVSPQEPLFIPVWHRNITDVPDMKIIFRGNTQIPWQESFPRQAITASA